MFETREPVDRIGFRETVKVEKGGGAGGFNQIRDGRFLGLLSTWG